jgi:hypothetical protein
MLSPTERRRLTIAEWRQAQGIRGANGVPEVLRALEFIAQQEVSRIRDGEPLRLTAKQLRIAQHRAISQQRKAETKNAPVPDDAELWWMQIKAIADRWNIKTEREHWEKKPVARLPRTEAAE